MAERLYGGQDPAVIPTKTMHFIERALADGEAEVRLATQANNALVKTSRAMLSPT